MTFLGPRIVSAGSQRQEQLWIFLDPPLFSSYNPAVLLQAGFSLELCSKMVLVTQGLTGAGARSGTMRLTKEFLVLLAMAFFGACCPQLFPHLSQQPFPGGGARFFFSLHQKYLCYDVSWSCAPFKTKNPTPQHIVKLLSGIIWKFGAGVIKRTPNQHWEWPDIGTYLGGPHQPSLCPHSDR